MKIVQWVDPYTNESLTETEKKLFSKNSEYPIIDGIPKELDEAMVVDGANLFTIFYKLIIPLAAPGLAVTALLSFLFAWNEYLLASTLSSVYARTIPTGLSEFVTTTGTNWGMMAAVAVVSMLPALLFLVLVQKYIVAGLTFGAVKT